jgi:multidrug efflux pump subunit AcrA (membrane-fusion protein)
VRLPKLANWLSEGDLEKYQQQAQQALAAQAKLQKTQSELKELKDNWQQTKKELQQAKAQLQINQGFQIELGETQLKLQKTETEAQRYKKELFEQQKQLNLLQSQLTKTKESLTKSQNWTQHIQTPIQVTDIKKTLPKQDFDTLWGFGIISPNLEFVTETGALTVKGWVLGKKSPAEVLRVISQTEQILETPIKIRRPKIVEQYPDISTANQCGFEFSLSVAGITTTVELNLEAVLSDQSIVPLCIIVVQPQLIESKGT